jgi:hypothetical protein
MVQEYTPYHRWSVQIRARPINLYESPPPHPQALVIGSIPRFALTNVTVLELFAYHGKAHLDMMFRCFSAFKDTLVWLRLSKISFGFEEMSWIVEFFPKLDSLDLWKPNGRNSGEVGPFQPPRRAVLPLLKSLDIQLVSSTLLLELYLLSGFAEASVDLKTLSVIGSVLIQVLCKSCWIRQRGL